MLPYKVFVPRRKKCLRVWRVLPIIVAVSAAFLWIRIDFSFSRNESAFEKLKERVIHFDEAVPGVYRGGLVPKQAVPLLKELGVKTVISFDNKKKRAQAEAEQLKLFGIHQVWIPWSGWDRPRDEDIEKFLTLMRTPELKPVYVHCKRGSERTGTAMAVWRVSEFGWPVEKAYDEMKRYEYRRFRQGHLKAYVYEYAREHGQADAVIANDFERMKTNVFYSFYQLKKLNPLLGKAGS